MIIIQKTNIVVAEGAIKYHQLMPSAHRKECSRHVSVTSFRQASCRFKICFVSFFGFFDNIFLAVKSEFWETFPGLWWSNSLKPSQRSITLHCIALHYSNTVNYPSLFCLQKIWKRILIGNSEWNVAKYTWLEFTEHCCIFKVESHILDFSETGCIPQD